MSYPYLRFDLDTPDDFDSLTQLVKSSNLNVDSTFEEIISAKISFEIQQKLESLFGLNRSLAGEDNRQTLKGLKDIIDLEIFEIPSGTKVFDWVVPQEWKISKGFIDDANGNRIIDIEDSPLHVASYSQPCNLRCSFDEVSSRIHTHENLSEAIPYRTLYYKADWAFCVNSQQLKKLQSAEQPLHLVIDSEFKNGSMSYAEEVLTGKSSREVLISSYICHPAMANDSLSGVLLTAMLARHLSSKSDRKWTYRIVFVPETIGAIAYLKLNEEKMKLVDFGLQITTVGGQGNFQVKESFDPKHFINSIVRDVLSSSQKNYETKKFDIHGSDERQYSSPGFRINMTTLAKDIYYTYPQYHTSLDNLDFVNGRQIAETFDLYVKVIEEIEKLKIYERVNPHGEPMLSKHGLYEIFGGSLLPNSNIANLDLVLSVLFMSDGLLPVSEIATNLKVDLKSIEDVCQILVTKNMLREI
jgi:aminopeptidase-like protein